MQATFFSNLLTNKNTGKKDTCMKPFLTRLLTCFFLLITPTVMADPLVFESGTQQTTLIELYTSEGCSSCPPADNWLARFKNDPRLWKQIIPVAFHVDYWDYIGWKDPFATPANTSRQQTHNRQKNVATIYTPGFVIAGKEWRGFFSDGILPAHEIAESGNLKVQINDTTLNVDYQAAAQALDFNIVILGFNLQTSVKNGENAGRILQHDFVALQHQVITSTNNQVQLDIPQMHTLRQQNMGIAIWVNKQNSLVPLQAVGGRLSM